jgi:hypothetical protein
MAAMEYAEELMGDFKVSNQDRESALIKLQTGLIDHYELLQE